jgi:hypothetical protein
MVAKVGSVEVPPLREADAPPLGGAEAPPLGEEALVFFFFFLVGVQGCCRASWCRCVGQLYVEVVLVLVSRGDEAVSFGVLCSSALLLLHGFCTDRIDLVNHFQGGNQGKLVDLVKCLLSLVVGAVDEGCELNPGRGVIVSEHALIRCPGWHECLVKDNVARAVEFLVFWIVANVSLVASRVAKCMLRRVVRACGAQGSSSSRQ